MNKTGELFVELVEVLAFPQPGLDVEFWSVAVQRDRVGGVRLELDSVGARCRCSLDDLECSV